MQEIWRDVWYDNKRIEGYKVSNKGRIYSVKTNRIMKPDITKAGYAVVRLSLGSRSNMIGTGIHRLVANAFLPNIGNYYTEVDHIDTNRLNNDISNLRWTTRSGNHSNPITVKRYSESKRGERNPNYKSGKCNIPREIHIKKVQCVETQEVFESIVDAAKKYNVEPGNIGRVAKGDRKTAGGYHWCWVQ